VETAIKSFVMTKKISPSKPYVRKTSIEVPVSVYERWDKLKVRYGVGHAATAGIILLDRIPAEEREDVIDEAKRLYLADKAAYEDKAIRKVIKNAQDESEADERKKSRRGSAKAG